MARPVPGLPSGTATIIPAVQGALAGTYTQQDTYAPDGQLTSYTDSAAGGLPAETPRFRHASPEQRFVGEAASELKSFSHEFRGLDDHDREAALLAVGDAFERADLTDRALFAVDLDAAKLGLPHRAGPLPEAPEEEQ